jgi:hypothetical protein
LEVRVLPDAYELWMSCMSRGIAVLRVPLTPSAVAAEGVPQHVLLHQNSPNPFKTSTTIRFTMPDGPSHPTSLRVYDLPDREVTTLVDGVVVPGEHRVTFDAAGLASGVYLYRLASGGRVEVRRMAVVK